MGSGHLSSSLGSPAALLPWSAHFPVPCFHQPQSGNKSFISSEIDSKTMKAGKCYHLWLECHTPSERLTPACMFNLNAVSLYRGFPLVSLEM